MKNATIDFVHMNRSFEKSLALRERLHSVIPGGAHTYAKGDDQFPEFMAPVMVRGNGCRVWDVDGNEFIEYGMGLRSVTLGHCYAPVQEAVKKQLDHGTNFNRPSLIELECAEEFLSMITGADMVKFAKNGSDVTTAAVKLARAYTGRTKVAICHQNPFFSVDDWFIGTTPVNAGIPQEIIDMTVHFNYNDLASLEALFDQYPGEISCVLLEAERLEPPQDNFLEKLKDLVHKNGAVLVFDEIMTGFRWHNGGAQAYHGVTPDLSTFAKALGNGFSISALAGKRELMDLGGLFHDKERVFLLSTTYGAETHSLAAAIATMKIYQEEPVIDHLFGMGERLIKGMNKSIEEFNLQGYFGPIGVPSCLLFYTRDNDGQPSQPMRTLFLQEIMKRGIIAPSFVMSYSHREEDIDQTVEAIHESLAIYRKGLDEGPEKYLHGKPVASVYRRYNAEGW